MSDSDSDISTEPQQENGSPFSTVKIGDAATKEKKVRKPRVQSEKAKAACQANVAKARAARAAKKAEKEQQKSEQQMMIDEMIAERKAKKAKKQLPEQSDDSDSSETDEEPALELRRPKKQPAGTLPKQEQTAPHPQMEELLRKFAAQEAELASLRSKTEKERAPVQVFFGGAPPKAGLTPAAMAAAWKGFDD